jgi:site-specific recombinase XerD
MLQVVKNGPQKLCEIDKNQSEIHHLALLESYFLSYRVRNYSPRTIEKERHFLEGWFKEHGLFVWEAMEPVIGRKRVQEYGNTLLENELQVDTVRSYLGTLRRYFSYVLEFPFIQSSGGPRRIQDIYGRIDQPVTEFDLPHHVYDGERLGVPLDPELLYSFYAVLRKRYLKGSQWQNVRARNYAMVVLAGESGLRVDELLNLKTSDLFFESKKLQTRHAKGTRGSGKRSRITLFPPLARDTIQYYLKNHRSGLAVADSDDSLFLSQSGQTLTYTTAHEALKEMIQVARGNGLSLHDHLCWHWFRRLFATRFIERFPGKLSVLIDLLGHVTPGTVHRYIRHSEAWMDNEIQNVLEGAVKWPSVGD